MVTIKLRHEPLDFDALAGDTIRFRVTAVDPSQVEGGTWLAQVRTDHEGEVVATFDVTPESEGSAFLTLDDATTTTLGGGFTGFWDCQVTTDDAVRTLTGGKLNLSFDISRP